MAQIPGNARVNQYTASAAQKVFIYEFMIYNDDEVQVQNGDTTLVLPTEYTVQDAGESSGGTITLVTGATNGDIITITGNSMIERSTTFTNGGDYLASAINGEYDRLDNITKEIVTGSIANMKLAKYSPSISTIVPSPSAGKAIKWNAAEDALELSTYDPDTQEAGAAESAAAAEVSAENAEVSAENAAASAASIDFTAVDSDIIPDVDDTRDLGSSSKQWATIYATEVLIDGASIARSKYARFSYTVPSGDSGGTCTYDAWQTRPINTEVVNDITGCSLGSNRITLVSGTYDFSVTMASGALSGYKFRLYNISDSSEEIALITGYSLTSTAGQTDSCTGRFTIAAQKIFEFQQYSAITRDTNGMGRPLNMGVIPENFLILDIFKI